MVHDNVYDFDADYAGAYWQMQYSTECNGCPRNEDSGRVTVHGNRVYHCGWWPKKCPFVEDD
jgi:hypothetical protein